MRPPVKGPRLCRRPAAAREKNPRSNFRANASYHETDGVVSIRKGAVKRDGFDLLSEWPGVNHSANCMKPEPSSKPAAESKDDLRKDAVRQARIERRSSSITVCLLALATALTFVCGCATDPAVRVQSKAKESTDFARYRTFAFKDSEGAFDPVYFSPANQKRVREAIVEELNQHGLQAGTNADLQVSIYLRIAEKQHDKNAPAFDDGKMGYNLKQYYGFYYGYDKAWAGQDRIQYKEGTLVIDLVDANQNVLVWQGIAVGVLYSQRTEQQIQQRVREALRAAFKDFPRTRR